VKTLQEHLALLSVVEFYYNNVCMNAVTAITILLNLLFRNARLHSPVIWA